ncbi:o-succinylbenzoate synthase [Neobacillus sp. YIM B06451]|uniref:o-succinylbenzoate synthase n=1 Tax=Neobacillus sp. YIM B06451 TaxID=3070994 RepID=UPI002931A2D7|nr:o-succinylbenzoate synthase [Neobacillus sp. YIM B06451]
MNLTAINVSLISTPLKQPFHTHLGTVTERESLIVEAVDTDGNSGFGEGVAFSSPWYTEETIGTSWHVVTEFLIPLLKKNLVSHPKDVSTLFGAIRRNHMAKSAIELALWDLYAKQKHVSLAKLIGGEADKIPSGVVVASKDEAEALEQTAMYVEEGYQRIKVKISPANDYRLLSRIRNAFPDLPIMADANSAYTLNDADRLKALDELGLLMIEQPLAHNDFLEHAKLQKKLATPICLDESINSYEDAVLAAELGSCRIISVKVGKVGGLSEAIRIHDFCRDRGIPVWCGGMIEFGVSRAHNIALASLPGFTIPGDISSSSRFWEEDIIKPEVSVENGWITVPKGPGIGFEVNRTRLEQTTIRSMAFRF